MPVISRFEKKADDSCLGSCFPSGNREVRPFPPGAGKSAGLFYGGVKFPPDATPVYPSPPPAPLSELMFMNAVQLGIKKSKSPWRNALLLSWQAGFYISIATIANVYTMALFNMSDHSLAYPIGRVLSALAFPLGLLWILTAGGDLITGNMFFILCAMLMRKATLKQALKNWGLVLMGNILGCLFSSILFGYGGEHFNAGSYPLAQMLRMAKEKVERRWLTNFVRAIGCNVLVSSAVYSGSYVPDFPGKAIAIWPLISAMILMQQEHIVVDLFAEPIALVLGLDHHFSDILLYSWLPVLLGNLVGAMLVAVPYHIAHGMWKEEKMLEQQTAADYTLGAPEVDAEATISVSTPTASECDDTLPLVKTQS
jgi:formate/nitrite transporter